MTVLFDHKEEWNYVIFSKVGGSVCHQGRQNEPGSERQIAQVSSPAGFEYESWAREGRRGSKEIGHKWVMGKECKTLPAFSPTENLKSYRRQGVEAGGLAVSGEERGWQDRGEVLANCNHMDTCMHAYKCHYGNVSHLSDLNSLVSLHS